MTEGGIATWKKKEGDSFSPGDVLVEIVRVCFQTLGGGSFRHAARLRRRGGAGGKRKPIDLAVRTWGPQQARLTCPHHARLTIQQQETDKATMDVEAQDEGVLAKILVGGARVRRDERV